MLFRFILYSECGQSVQRHLPCVRVCVCVCVCVCVVRACVLLCQYDCVYLCVYVCASAGLCLSLIHI